MKEKIINLLKNNISLDKEQIEKLLEIPPSPALGDYSFPCFQLSKQFKKNPSEISKDLKTKIEKKLPKEIEKIEIKGPYLNFFLDKKILVKNLLKNINPKTSKTNKQIMIEFPSPNTNKPLHLGHLRNMAIGESVSRIFEYKGFKVIRANLNNDRGIHICKSMLAYKKFGKNKTPLTEGEKSDHFVGDFYVLFNEKSKQDDNLNKEAQELLRKWENNEKSTRELWKKMNLWALQGFKQTYNTFGIKHDKVYFESKIYKKGKEIIQEGLKKGIFQEKDGAVIVDLINEGLGEKILLRKDKTSVYITQDIYLAKLKNTEFKLDKCIYVVGNEQDYHFNVLFSILKKLNYSFSDKLVHLSYGMVNLPEGKMKSREGTVVDADDLIYEVKELVKKELNSRYKLSKKELETRSLKIALGAIKYFLLKVDSKKNLVFNPKESINFEGDTGPYIQYSYARASSILKKSKLKINKNLNIKSLNKKEIELVKKLSQFQEVVFSSYKNLNPSLIANYSYQLAKIFNEFYHECPVINSENQDFRILLVENFRIILKNSLFLLGIDILEEM